MTCRGSRFADGAKRNPDGQVFMKNRETDEWLKQNNRSTRNFIRKWGHFVKHDAHLKPIVPPKYDIGLVVHNCNYETLYELEPWCSSIYVDSPIIQGYIDEEQPNTLFDLRERVNSKMNEATRLRIELANSKPYLDIMDVSLLSNKSISTIRRKISEGILKSYQDVPKGKLLFKRSDIFNFRNIFTCDLIYFCSFFFQLILRYFFIFFSHENLKML